MTTTKITSDVLDDAAARINVKDGGSLIVNSNDINFIDGTGITVSIVDTAGQADITITSSVTQLTTEEVQDIAGAMTTSNTETLITVTYQDGDGTIDYVVEANLSNYTNDGGFREEGKETLWIPANAMTPAETNGAETGTVETTTNDVNFDTLAFDGATDEYAHFNIAFPKSWNLGTVTFQVYWTNAASGGDDVAWGLQGVSLSNSGPIDTAFGTAVVVVDSGSTGTFEQTITAESGAVTIAGTPVDDDQCYFRVLRDVSADDQVADALLLGIKLFYTTDAANDD